MYGKIFASLYQGTLRGRAHEILVFTNMIACADQTGIVDKHPKAIAEEVGLDIDATRSAIASLEAADPESRSLDHGGARIVKAFDGRAWGWHIVNYAKYRAIRSEEDRREQNRLAQERYRRNNSKPPSAEVSQGKPPSAESKQDKPKEKEREKEKEKENTQPRQARGRASVHVADCPPSLADIELFVAEVDGLIPAEEFLDSNARAGWMYGRGKGRPVLDWQAHYRTWNRKRLADEERDAPLVHVPTQEQIAELKENQRG